MDKVHNNKCHDRFSAQVQVTYICVVWRAGPQSSERRLARLCLSPCGALRHRDAEPGRLRTRAPTQSNTQQREQKELTRKMSSDWLTWRQFDLQRCPDQGHQCWREVDCVVLTYGHVHPHQTLWKTLCKLNTYNGILRHKTNTNLPNLISHLLYVVCYCL